MLSLGMIMSPSFSALAESDAETAAEAETEAQAEADAEETAAETEEGAAEADTEDDEAETEEAATDAEEVNTHVTIKNNFIFIFCFSLSSLYVIANLSPIRLRHCRP